MATDSRLVHSFMFNGLTPEHFDYFAGHYRGEEFRCLVTYEVGVPGDRRVGHPAATVPMEMNAFSLSIGKVIEQLDYHYGVPNAIFSPAHKLIRAIELAAAVFVYFLEIHPYANGNGHMARWILMCLLSRHGIYLNASFDLHPRPAEPRYSQAIVQYRNNNKAPLHILLMECL
ncbi:Fic family protein [Rhizobium sp. NLR10a]|nr:Fic family protein [Rhizobium sp. NLR10a]